MRASPCFFSRSEVEHRDQKPGQDQRNNQKNFTGQDISCLGNKIAHNQRSNEPSTQRSDAVDQARDYAENARVYQFRRNSPDDPVVCLEEADSQD